MKPVLIVLLSSMMSLCFAQSKEGVITYESITRIDVSRIPPEMKGMIPPERKSKNQLFFNEQEAIYKTIKEDEDINQEVSAGDGNRIRFRMRGAPDNESYTNLENGTAINKTEFFGRTFLIEGGDEIEWKITSEMEAIAGYQCVKATYMRDTIPVAVWFTPQIPISLGPEEFGGLPGMVLSVDINDGQRTIKVTEVELRSLANEETIVAPTKGKKVTREEFRAIQAEKMAEMQEMNGGSGGAVIIRN
ncbi:MAG: GLPGLI family protein [Cyclobacteriaceae bacterium]